MKTFDFVQATISHHLKDPHSKALEPDCFSPFVCDHDTATAGGGVRHFLFNKARDLTGD